MSNVVPWRPRPDGIATPQRSAIYGIPGRVLSGNRENALVVKREWTEIENPAPRIPCVIVADGSSSMAGAPIHAENLGIQKLGEYVRLNTLAARTAEIAIVRVGDPLEVLLDFTVAERFNPPEIFAWGGTPLAEGILLAIQLVFERIHYYEKFDCDFFKPWIIILSDGQPNRTNAIPEAIRAVRRVEQQRLMAVYGVGVNAEATRNLQAFSVRRAEELSAFDFEKLFRWFSQRMILVSQTTPGEEPEDPDMNKADWRKR